MPDNDTIESFASDFRTPFRALLDHCENKGMKFRANQKKSGSEPSLPDARPHSDRPRSAGRKSNFLAALV